MSQTIAPPETAASRGPRWIWILLVVSLAGNLLLIGLIAGAAWFRHSSGGSFASSSNPFGFIRSLPKERREVLRAASRDDIAGLRPLWKAVREARREANRLLTAEPFDGAAFLAAQRRVVDSEHAARSASAQVLSEAAAKLTPDERRRMSRWHDRGRGGRGGRDGDDRPAGPNERPPPPSPQ